MNTSPFMECEGFHAVKGDVLYDRATKGGRNMVIVLQKGIPEKEKQDLKSFLIRIFISQSYELIITFVFYVRIYCISSQISSRQL